MAEGFDAGSIFFALRAQIEGVQKNVQKVERTLDGLGNGVRSAAKKVQTGGQEISAGLQKATASTNDFNAKLAGTVTQMIAMQTIVTQLAEVMGESEFAGEVRAGANALLVFATTAVLIPGPVGLVIAVLGALVTLIFSLATASSKAGEETLKFVAAIKEMNRVAREAEAEDLFLGLFGELPDLEVQIARREKQIRGLIGVTESFDLRVRRLLASLKEGTITTKQFQGAFALLQTNTEKARQAIIRFRDEVIDLREKFKKNEEIKEFNEALDALTEKSKRVQDALVETFITPLQAAQAQLAIARERVLTFAASFDELDPDEILNRFPDFEQFKKDAEAARLAVERLQKQLTEIAPADAFRAAFADPLAANIGDAVFQGILEGQEAIEILGAFAENVFSTSLATAVEGFQKGMSDVLTQIAGSAGGVIGNILTGIAGIAAGIFLNRKGESTNTFSEVQSRIQSTQAVRGVVAGPTSIPIASVGSNLERAFVPVNERLDAMIEHLRNISANTSRGPDAGSGKIGFAGDVSTA